MERILKIVNAEYAYKRGIYGQGIVVAVLDTGIAPHPDLHGKTAVFRDYVNNKGKTYDDNGHGTHIAGIIAANNGTNLHGVAPECKLHVCKVLDQNGNGRIEDICRALEELTEMKRHERGILRIINISVGMTDSVAPGAQQRLLDAVETAWDSGMVVIAAAGNNGPAEHTVTSPGISRKIITVGSIDDGDRSYREKGYSGRGPTDECVVKPEILMPGTNILSCLNRGGGYTKKSGTSMAAPVLTGMIALLLCAYPSLSPNEVKMRLFYAAKPVGGAEERGWGTVSMESLL
ncbi:MAG: S8 family peptidase [Clostridiales bacterium]|nr:S8 family peptidase [Clostridiales bacterium]